MANLVAYMRVSTAGQGRSGLGLEAQQEAIYRYATAGNHTIIREFIEIDGGGNLEREKIHQALELCKLTGSTLVMKTLARLARDVAFVATLMKSGTAFIVTDMPGATNLTLHIMASIDEWERKEISKRTKEALHVAKERGPKFCPKRNRMTYPLGAKGQFNLSDQARAIGREEAIKVIKENAFNFAKRIEPILLDCNRHGMNLTEICTRLQSLGVKTARGNSTWYPATVRNCINLLKGL